MLFPLETHNQCSKREALPKKGMLAAKHVLGFVDFRGHEIVFLEAANIPSPGKLPESSGVLPRLSRTYKRGALKIRAKERETNMWSKSIQYFANRFLKMPNFRRFALLGLCFAAFSWNTAQAQTVAYVTNNTSIQSTSAAGNTVS